MRIAWFRATPPDTANPLDDTAPLLHELRASHEIDVITEANAHDFVWQHLRHPRDLCVFELDRTRPFEFIWGYLVNYPGVVALRTTNLPHLSALLRASRSIVVPTLEMAETLRGRCPQAHIRVATPGVPSKRREHRPVDAVPRVAVFDSRAFGSGVVQRALERARTAGAVVDTLVPDANAIADCDVVVAPAWPPFDEPLTPALAGMAAAKAVITTEVETTAGWAALDPQTWRPRSGVTGAPVVVTIDPRDEEHSLMLAIRRLSSDRALRAQLGDAAFRWWSEHATPAHAAASWQQVLDDTERLPPPPRSGGWPKEFDADGTELMREIVSEIGVVPPI